MTADPVTPQMAFAELAVGVVGAGTMGGGIAQVAAQAGHRVLLYDSRGGAASNAIQTTAESLHALAVRGRLTSTQAEGVAGRIHAAEDLRSLSPCGLILEAIAEDLEAKRTLFRSLEELVSPETLLATNTSSLSVTAIGADLRHPERLAGMHFFNPAPRMPLVEIVAGLASAPETLDKFEAIARSWGKETVRARSNPGFIVNRIARPFYGEALRLFQEQAGDPATLDAIFREAGGFRMGPFELMDMIGHDINFAVTSSVYEATFQDPRFRPSLLQKEMVDANRLGIKTGRGFYSYDKQSSREKPQNSSRMPAPGRIELFGNDPLGSLLRDRFAAVQQSFQQQPFPIDQRLAATPNATLYRTDGRSATQRAHDLSEPNLVLVDLATNYNVAKRLALTVANQANPGAIREITGLLQAAGFAISVLDDAPGMAVMRTVAMLANEAANAVHQGVCSVVDCDRAMRLGTNYPEGPLAWADSLGAGTLVTVLDHLFAAYGDARYRVSPLLRRKALTDATFYSPTRTPGPTRD